MANGGFGVSGDAKADTRHPSIPLAAKGYNFTVFDSTPSTGAQTPLTANFKAGSVVDLGKAGSCALSIKYDADASGTANRPQLLVLVSNAESQPLITADEWVALSELEISGTDAVLTDSMPTDVDITVQPEFVVKKLRGLAIDLYAADAGTDKLRLGLVVDVRRWRWLCVLAKEEGDTDAGDVGVLVVQAALNA
jgi:hypothetical protein